MGNAVDDDSPRCPSCNYHLTGLLSLTCPECGTQLDSDFSLYRASAASTPWSAVHPKPIWRGAFWVLFYPVRTFARIKVPGDATKLRALVFAAIVSVLAIVLWGVIRSLVLAFYYTISGRPDEGLVMIEHLFRPVLAAYRWRFWLWESGSLVRLWLLFISMTLIICAGRFKPANFGLPLRRLLLFAPWLIMLDVSIMLSGIIMCGGCMPEPSSLFYSDWDQLKWRMFLQSYFLERFAVPALVFGFLYCKWVLRMRWNLALPIALLIYVPMTYMSQVWSCLYGEIYELIH